jgi:hypothetical protein
VWRSTRLASLVQRSRREDAALACPENVTPPAPGY